MSEQQFPEPFNEALARSGERSIQLLSVVAYGGQVMMRWTAAQQEKRAHRLARQQRELELERQRARLRWAPAHDPAWLRQADIIQTARVWGATLPYAHREMKQFDPTAESAMRKCEDRLRTLHPHAMARYDRLRQDGWAPGAAMREAAPLFDRPPNVHESRPGRRPSGELGMAPPGTIPPRGATFTLFPHGPSKAEYLAVRRAERITDRLTASAREQGRQPLGRGELRTVLEAMTNLPPRTIDHVTASVPETSRAGDVGLELSMAQRAAAAERTRAADLNMATDDPATHRVDERSDELRDTARQAAAAAAYRTGGLDDAVDVAARDFPFTAQQVVNAAQHAPTPAPTRAATARTAFHRVYNGRR